MSLGVPGLSRYSFTFDNFGSQPQQNPGTSVTPGASNAEGSWTQVASSSNIAQDVYGLFLLVTGGATGGAQRSHLLDVGVDSAGGTSYVSVIDNIVCGTSGGVAGNCGHPFFFPLFIKAGSSVAVRAQGDNATAGSLFVAVKFFGQPSNPAAVPVGSFSETIGTITNSGGVSFTPGNATAGSWVSLGTTAKAMWWWQLAYQVSNATITAEHCYIDLAFGDATNKQIILRRQHSGNPSEQIGSVTQDMLTPWGAYCPVPAGAEIWVRGHCNNAPDSGYNAVAIGVGG